MKKIILSFAAALCIFAMTSCGSPASKVAGYMNDATEQIKAANGDEKKIQEAVDECTKKCEEVTKDMSEEEQAKLLEDKEVQEAMGDYMAATLGAAFKSLGK
ncbi:MAG: hypothetical protein NC402_01520 [Prevotella sp.]|nr:hypothetical protein [Prevotella sp.]MCM1074544.1 hypothetical protein [Ruminococcus sp.]